MDAQQIDELDWTKVISIGIYYSDTIKLFLPQYLHLTIKDQNRLRKYYKDIPQYQSFQIVYINAGPCFIDTRISILVEST